jgi:hypothetical protein
MAIFAEKNAAALSCMLLIEPCRAPYDVYFLYVFASAEKNAVDHESETLARQAGDSKWKDGKINQAESAVLVTRFFSRKQIGFQLIDTECVRCVSDQRSMQPMNKVFGVILMEL